MGAHKGNDNSALLSYTLQLHYKECILDIQQLYLYIIP